MEAEMMIYVLTLTMADHVSCTVTTEAHATLESAKTTAKEYAEGWTLAWDKDGTTHRAAYGEAEAVIEECPLQGVPKMRLAGATKIRRPVRR